MKGIYFIPIRLFHNASDFTAAEQFCSGIFLKLGQKVIPEDMGIIGVFLCQKGAVADSFSKVPVGGQRIAGDVRIPAEFMEFFCVRPGKMPGGCVDLFKFKVNAEGKVIHKSFEVTGAFHCCCQRAGIMVAHMHPGLIDISSPGKGCFVHFQHRDLFAFPGAVQGGI